ncbi:MAG: hypothetical protein ACR2FU_04825 [Streptosporangiaceae bacterium]
MLLAAGLGLRVAALVAYRPAIFYIDTPRYLLNSVPGMDPDGYGAVLKAILAAGHLDLVVLLQHLAGLAMAVVLYVVLQRRGVWPWLAAVAIAPVLLDAYQVQIEQALMPDVWFEAMIVAGLAILAWRPGTGWRRVLAAGLVLGTSATVAQVGEALLLPAVIFVLAAARPWRRAAGQVAALCAAFAVPILAYSAGSALTGGGFFLSHAGATSLYGRAAAAADCATLQLPAAERPMCPDPAQQAHGPDWLEYNSQSPLRAYYPGGRPTPRTDPEITDFNHRVLTQQPARLLSAYLSDVVKVFAPVRGQSGNVTPLSRWQFQLRYPFFPPWTSRPVVVGAIAKFGGGTPAVIRPLAVFLRAYQLHGGYTPGPLLAGCVLAGLGGSALVLRRRSGQQARRPALACLLFCGSAVFLLAVSDLFEFSWRYQLPALVTLVPAGALGVAAIAAARRDRSAGRQGEYPAAAADG